MWIFCSGAVGKGKLFWFFSIGFVWRQKPNVLDRALAFYTDAQLLYNVLSCPFIPLKNTLNKDINTFLFLLISWNL